MFVRATLLSAVMLVCVALGGVPALADPGPAPTQSGLVPSPAQLQFGAVGIHFGGSVQESVALWNESASAVVMAPGAITGTDASSFQIVYDGCAYQTVWPGASCPVEIRFQPDGRGEKSASLGVEELGGEGAVQVPLTGTGSTGTLSANTDAVHFSSIPHSRGEHEENQSETEQVNIESEVAGVQIESVSIVGPDASSFSIQYGDCEGDQLASNNWCDAGVRFQPLSPGLKQAQLVIVSDASNSPLVVALEGEGLLGPKISLDSDEALLGDVPIGTSVSHTFTVGNSGDYPLFIEQSFLVSGTPKMFPFISNTCSGEIILPGASCVFTVGFEPSAQGEKDASIIFITNATPQINVLGIDGIGVAPAPAPVASGPVPLTAQLATPTEGRRSVGVAFRHLFTFDQASRVDGSTGGEAVDTGVSARCPASAGVCRTEDIITARVHTYRARAALQGGGHTTVLLGSHVARMSAGELAAVRIPLSSRAVALLERRGHIRATIELVIRSGGRIIAERARMVTLAASSATS